MSKPTEGGARPPRLMRFDYSAATLPVSALAVAVAVHMPAYFAASMGAPLAAVAAAFGTVRLIDVPLEMVLGIGMDRTRTRLGRYRLWLILGAPILMLGLYMLLNASHGVGTGYLIVWLLVMYLGFSILTLAHQAWAAKPSPGPTTNAPACTDSSLLSVWWGRSASWSFRQSCRN